MKQISVICGEDDGDNMCVCVGGDQTPQSRRCALVSDCDYLRSGTMICSSNNIQILTWRCVTEGGATAAFVVRSGVVVIRKCASLLGWEKAPAMWGFASYL